MTQEHFRYVAGWYKRMSYLKGAPADSPVWEWCVVDQYAQLKVMQELGAYGVRQEWVQELVALAERFLLSVLNRDLSAMHDLNRAVARAALAVRMRHPRAAGKETA